MKIALATVDLLPGRERLMPWRTVIEAAKYAAEMGHEIEVLTLSVQKDNINYSFEGVKILSAPRYFDVFCKFVANVGYDALAYPTPWREGLKNLYAFHSLKCRKVAYFPGGSYQIANIYALWKNVGWQASRPYLIDWLTPYKMLMHKLKTAGFNSVIAQSPYTANTCIKGGFGDVRMIVPGKDNFDTLEENIKVFERLDIKRKKLLLFSGAPAPIRGASFLLECIDELAKNSPDVFCLFMMRKDVGSDYSRFEQTYKEMKHKECVQILDVRVNRNELKTIMTHARAVVLPFMLVPSEIPITFFEVLSLGIPVVTFSNGGTTDYLHNCLLQSKPGNKKGMVVNLQRVWNDNTLCEMLGNKALAFMSHHPSWNDAGRMWLEALIGNKKNIKST